MLRTPDSLKRTLKYGYWSLWKFGALEALRLTSLVQVNHLYSPLSYLVSGSTPWIPLS
jgi:hypothetical protein